MKLAGSVTRRGSRSACGVSSGSPTHSSRRLAGRAAKSPLRRLHRDPERLADLRPGEAVLVAGAAHELGAQVTRFLLDTGHQQRPSKRTLDATTTGRDQCPQRIAHDTPLPSGQSIDLHQHLPTESTGSRVPNSPAPSACTNSIQQSANTLGNAQLSLTRQSTLRMSAGKVCTQCLHATSARPTGREQFVAPRRASAPFRGHGRIFVALPAGHGHHRCDTDAHDRRRGRAAATSAEHRRRSVSG